MYIYIHTTTWSKTFSILGSILKSVMECTFLHIENVNKKPENFQSERVH